PHSNSGSYSQDVCNPNAINDRATKRAQPSYDLTLNLLECMNNHYIQLRYQYVVRSPSTPSLSVDSSNTIDKHDVNVSTPFKDESTLSTRPSWRYLHLWEGYPQSCLHGNSRAQQQQESLQFQYQLHL